MRRELEPIELDILASVQKEQTAIKRDIYKKFIGRKEAGKYSESFLYRKFLSLAYSSYIKQSPKIQIWCLSAKGKGALVRQRGSINGCGVKV